MLASRAPARAPADKATAPARAHDTGPEQTPRNPVWGLLATRAQSARAASAPDDPNGARLHTDAAAAAAAERLGAAAFTVGRDVFFGRSQYAPGTPRGDHVLRHELAHVAQSHGDVARGSTVGGARPGLRVADADHPAEREAEQIASRGGHATLSVREPMVFRIPAVPRPVARKNRDQIVGNAGLGIPSIDLAAFQDYTEQEQADWFVEPTLTAADRAFLWDMLLTLREGGHIRLGIGDVTIADLQTVVAADWPALKAFCRGTDPSQRTVRFFPPHPPLADRIARGRALLDLEATIPADQANVTISQGQLETLRTTVPPLMPLLSDYWTRFEPFLETTYTPAPGANGPEFQLVITFLTTVAPTGLAPLLPLQGASAAARWVRNLHRFPLPMLLRLVTNLSEFGGTRDFVLVLHTAHDAVGAFHAAVSLFSNLVLNTGAVTVFGRVFGPNNLVLMIEGPTSLADVTARIPGITTTYGKRDALGNRHITQVVIAGHGSGHTVSLAGAGPPAVAGGRVTYPEESVDPHGNLINTQALLDTLLTHMDPATARLLYAGCLVGSRTVPAGTPAAGIPAALAADQSLGAFTEARAVAAGIPVVPGTTVQAARASVGLSAVTTLTDASGRLRPTYPFDPNAFGGAAAYTQSGQEPEGVLRAAVEIGATVGVVPAETMLRTRMGMPAAPANWYDTITRLMVTQVLPGVVGAGVNLHLVNEAANTAEVPFLVFWSSFYWIDAAAYVTRLNPQPFAAPVYAGLAGTIQYAAPASDDHRRMRVVIDQGNFVRTGAAPALFAGITASGLNATTLQNHLDITATVLGGREATLLPLVGAPTAEQIRLALAWFERDRANAHVRAYLSAQVVTAVGVAPAFNAATLAEITSAGMDARTILTNLGFVLAPAGAPVGGGPPPPLANVRVPGNVQNTVFVTPQPRRATVIPAAVNVRGGPSMAFPPFTVVHAGDVVNVSGEAGNWAAIDFNGRLGFIFKSLLTP